MPNSINTLSRSSSTLRLFACTMVVLASCTGSSRADFLLSIVPSAITGTVGTGIPTNKFEVDLTNTGLLPVTIGSFGFSVTTSSPLITLNDALINGTSAPYIFAGASLFSSPGGSISITTGQTLSAADSSTHLLDATPGGTSVGAGNRVSLGLVTFDVSSAIASGTYLVTLLPNPDTTLSDPSGTNIPIAALAGGTIVVNNPTVPEPSAFVLAAAGIALLFTYHQQVRVRRLSEFTHMIPE